MVLKLGVSSSTYLRLLTKFGISSYKLKQNGVAGNLLITLANFLKDRKQGVVTNGQNSAWVNVEAGAPQSSILVPLLFLIYLNDLSENLVLNPKLFVDDKSLFSVVFDKDFSAKNLNDDLNRINNGAFQWKMSFNSHPNKQTQEVLFSRKIQKSSQPSLVFNNNTVTQSITQKHLGMFLDTKLDFQEHLKSIFSKVVNKAIGLLRKLHHILTRSPLLTIYKSFIRPHLDYGDIIYHQAYNASFYQKLDSIQYNAALAIRSNYKEKEKLYNELGFENLEKRR